MVEKKAKLKSKHKVKPKHDWLKQQSDVTPCTVDIHDHLMRLLCLIKFETTRKN